MRSLQTWARKVGIADRHAPKMAEDVLHVLRGLMVPPQDVGKIEDIADSYWTEGKYEREGSAKYAADPGMAEAAKRVTGIENDIRRVLASNGWKFKHGETHGKVSEYDFESRMNFESPNGGSLYVVLNPNSWD